MKLPSALITTAPLVGLDAAKVMVSFSASTAVTVPVTTPVTTLGVPTVALAPVGAVFCGLMVTVTGTATEPPNPSATVTVNVSALSDAAAVVAAALCRPAAVGV